MKLLRALQEGEIRRVGATREIRVDGRVIAATNRNLEREVKAGSFREDLFYPLSVVTLRVPPLIERRTDIPLLADRFLQGALERNGRSHLSLSEETIRTLVAYDWPGNGSSSSPSYSRAGRIAPGVTAPLSGVCEFCSQSPIAV